MLRKCQCKQGPAEVSLIHIIFLLQWETSANREQKLNLLDNVNVILHQNNIDTTYSFTPHQASCVVCFYISLEVSQSSFQTIHPIHMLLISGMKSHKFKLWTGFQYNHNPADTIKGCYYNICLTRLKPGNFFLDYI